MIPCEVHFEVEGHRYWIEQDGRRQDLPGVTRLLKEFGLVDDTYYSAASSHRGRMVHRACTLDDQGILDESTVDPAIKGYLQGWREFKSIWTPRWTAIEEIVGDLGLFYCGRADRVGRFHDQDHLTVVDIKSAVKTPWHKYQLALYIRGLTERWFEEKVRGLIVYVKDTGKFSLTALNGLELLQHVRDAEGMLMQRKQGALGLWNESTSST